MIHGGDIQSFYEEFKRKPLDFSANISPLGIPKKVEEILIQEIKSVEEYPDPLCRILRSKLSEQYAFPTDFFLCGNGAADLIYRIVLAVKPKKALLFVPTFAEYEECLNLVSCEINYYDLKESLEFKVEEDVLNYLKNDTDICFICQPNNPTGQLFPKKLLLKILEKAKEINTILVIDECFIDFLKEEKDHSLLEEIEENSHLIILRAFTKIYALAGLRLGFMLSSNSLLLHKIQKQGQPWGVSTLAQKAGIVALEQREYVEKVKFLIAEERVFLENELNKLGFKVYPSAVNYILFYSQVETLAEQLKEKNILIRDCSNYRGLKKGFYRVAVKDRPSNLLLIQALESR